MGAAVELGEVEQASLLGSVERGHPRPAFERAGEVDDCAGGRGDGMLRCVVMSFSIVRLRCTLTPARLVRFRRTVTWIAPAASGRRSHEAAAVVWLSTPPVASVAAIHRPSTRSTV